MGTEGDFAVQLLKTMSDGVYTVDRDRRITYWSPGAERLTGYASADVVGRRCRDGLLNHVDASGRLLCHTGCPLAATMDDGGEREAHLYLHHKDGHRRPVVVRAAALHDETDSIVGAVEVFNDDSSCSRLSQQLTFAAQEALTDPLTGMSNRRMLIESLDRMPVDLRSDASCAVLYVDIDHFKRVNDQHGHAVGDTVLRMVAATLQACTRPSDVVGRWGGEEFLVLVAPTERLDVEHLAERLRAQVRHSWVEVGGRRLNVTVSVGVAMASPLEDVHHLVERADHAMLAAKRAGRNRVEIAQSPRVEGAHELA